MHMSVVTTADKMQLGEVTFSDSSQLNSKSKLQQ